MRHKEKAKCLFPLKSSVDAAEDPGQSPGRGPAGSEALKNWVVLGLFKHIFWVKTIPFLLIRKQCIHT